MKRNTGQSTDRLTSAPLVLHYWTGKSVVSSISMPLFALVEHQGQCIIMLAFGTAIITAATASRAEPGIFVVADRGISVADFQVEPAHAEGAARFDEIAKQGAAEAVALFGRV